MLNYLRAQKNVWCISNNKKILVNKIQWKKRKDIIESKHILYFKWCACKSIAVDGDLEYFRRVENIEDIIELSDFEKKEVVINESG